MYLWLQLAETSFHFYHFLKFICFRYEKCPKQKKSDKHNVLIESMLSNLEEVERNMTTKTTSFSSLAFRLVFTKSGLF